MTTTLVWSERDVMGPYGVIDQDLMRDSIDVLARYLCHYEEGIDPNAEGVQQGDLIFEFITEGRQTGNPKYSACGDLCHAVLWALLVLNALTPAARALARKVVNRQEAYGWASGVNISRLSYGAGKHYEVLAPGKVWLPHLGDLGHIGENGLDHVFVAEHADDKLLTSFDYGQFWSRKDDQGNALPGKHGGIRRSRSLARAANRRLLAGKAPQERPVMGHVNVLSWLQEIVDACDGPETWLVRMPVGWEQTD